MIITEVNDVVAGVNDEVIIEVKVVVFCTYDEVDSEREKELHDYDFSINLSSIYTIYKFWNPISIHIG